jgi:hypothetical protein
MYLDAQGHKVLTMLEAKCCTGELAHGRIMYIHTHTWGSPGIQGTAVLVGSTMHIDINAHTDTLTHVDT